MTHGFGFFFGWQHSQHTSENYSVKDQTGDLKKKENFAYSAANMCTMQRHTIKLVSPVQRFSVSRLNLKPIVVLFIYSSLLVCLATPTVSYIFGQK